MFKKRKSIFIKKSLKLSKETSQMETKSSCWPRVQNVILIKISNQIFFVLCDMVVVDLNAKIFEKLKKILKDILIFKSLSGEEGKS